jgi:hypothetical protein
MIYKSALAWLTNLPGHCDSKHLSCKVLRRQYSRRCYPSWWVQSPITVSVLISIVEVSK